MPRLSLYREQRSNDYRFFDRIVREQLDVGGTVVNVHKYLGSESEEDPPGVGTNSEQNIQDLLFLENRDRKYDTSVYSIRGHYNVNSIDFDLSQFGLFLQNDTIFIVFHLNDMVATLGRKIMSGDVLELPHLREFYPLDASIPAALRRYYVVQDATRASEGYSPTWWPHLWRVKATPLVSGQEYRQLLEDVGEDSGLGDLLDTYKKNIEINDAIIEEALRNVPESGYDTSELYTLPLKENNYPNVSEAPTADNTSNTADSIKWRTDEGVMSPRQSAYTGYLVGDGLAPNGHPVTPAIEFPTGPMEGDFVLRLDYMPNRLFRYDGTRWVKVEDDVRTNYHPSAGNTQLGGFISNDTITTAPDGRKFNEQQKLSELIKPKADN